MDRNALELIQETAIKAAEKNLTQVEGHPLLVGNAKTNLINLEQFQKNRNRFRGAYETQSIIDFSNHVKERSQGKPDTHLFINAESFKALAIYNYGNDTAPGHCDDVAVLSLQKTAAFTALEKINGARFDQKNLIDFIEDWNAVMVPYDATGENYSLATAIGAIRNITIAATSDTTSIVGDFKQSVSAFDEIEAKAKGIPTGFLFTCIPYNGLISQTFKVRLSVLTTEKIPMLVTRIVGFEQQKETIVQGFKTDLLKFTEGAARAYIGTFNPK